MPITTAAPRAEIVTGFDVSLLRTGSGEAMSAQDRTWPGLMRRAGRAHLGIWELEGLVEKVELLVSELVTNGFQHGRGETVEVRLWRTEVYVCMEVSSGVGKGMPCVREAGPMEESGRGLGLVAVVADAWGVTPDGDCTWCMVDVPAAPAG
ncbi:ATPase [Streptomyces inusitatus]|uniref:ATPase n=1 Tax=Streptomyces inusitatus TaxID=68221 RepID=A0A918UJ01_9ACTN|nr:ATP-binding protein [Streptomyces inusitatus]GGZ13851.1 ATPase [Streptomyces inusitatus]